MDAESRIKTMAERYGWPDDVVQDVRTLLAAECNAAFVHGRQVEREAWRMRRGVYLTADGNPLPDEAQP